MNLLAGRLSKILALLAVMSMPMQQSLAATCCCQQGDVTLGRSLAAGCCSAGQNGCCGGVSDSVRSCCQGSESQSGAKPCHCSVGGCSPVAPEVPVSQVPEISSDDILMVSVIDTMGLLVGDTTNAVSPCNGWVRTSPSGARLCVFLCRFTL